MLLDEHLLVHQPTNHAAYHDWSDVFLNVAKLLACPRNKGEMDTDNIDRTASQLIESLNGVLAKDLVNDISRGAQRTGMTSTPVCVGGICLCFV